MPGKFSPPPRVSDPGMHHGTCVTHVPWCMQGSLSNDFLWSRRRGKTFPAFPAHAQTAILRIWQEAHANDKLSQNNGEIDLCNHGRDILDFNFPITCVGYNKSHVRDAIISCLPVNMQWNIQRRGNVQCNTLEIIAVNHGNFDKKCIY